MAIAELSVGVKCYLTVGQCFLNTIMVFVSWYYSYLKLLKQIKIVDPIVSVTENGSIGLQ